MGRSENDATVIGVSAAVVYDVISATNSSPQTTEINAGARAATLMKWVNIGLAQAAFFVGLMTIAEPKGKKWRPLTGGGIAGLLLWAQYIHARNAGIQTPGAPTETYAGTLPGHAYGPNASGGAQPTWVGSTGPSTRPPHVKHPPTRIRVLRHGIRT